VTIADALTPLQVDRTGMAASAQPCTGTDSNRHADLASESGLA